MDIHHGLDIFHRDDYDPRARRGGEIGYVGLVPGIFLIFFILFFFSLHVEIYASAETPPRRRLHGLRFDRPWDRARMGEGFTDSLQAPVSCGL